jgi:hypothetical protein
MTAGSRRLRIKARCVCRAMLNDPSSPTPAKSVGDPFFAKGGTPIYVRQFLKDNGVPERSEARALDWRQILTALTVAPAERFGYADHKGLSAV